VYNLTKKEDYMKIINMALLDENQKNEAAKN